MIRTAEYPIKKYVLLDEYICIVYFVSYTSALIEVNESFNLLISEIFSFITFIKETQSTNEIQLVINNFNDQVI